MSTDDSISEDVSSSGALSHCHASADGDGGKESETSLVSSEGTSASGLAVSEDRHSTSQTTGGTVESRPMDITPACNKIRSLCLSTNEAFEQGKSLPFINPSFLETLRVSMQKIQSSGETNPEIRKYFEDRLFHLFQLLEKQYQEQVLAQQELYQCQLQLIQDELMALIQHCKRKASVQPHAEFSPSPTLQVTKTTTNTKDYLFPLISSDCTVPKNFASDTDSLAAPAHTPFSSPSPPLQRSETTNQGEERVTTVLSIGYGTLSAWETTLEPSGSPGTDEDGSQGREKHHLPSNFQEDTETTVIGCQQDFSSEKTLGGEELNPLVYQQRTSGTSQLLTSWAQRQKLRPRKSKGGQASSKIPEYQEPPRSPRESHKQNPLEGSDSPDQQQAAGPSSSSLPLRRSDSLMSEASGLTYWRLNESELYHPLPDSFDSGAYLPLQEASMSLTPSQEPQLSLRESYQNKQRTEGKRSDWEGSVTSSPSSPQMLTLDPAANQQQSDRTSGFASPSHFSSPTFAAQPHLYPRVGTPVTPDSMVECSPNPGDTDCISDTSSFSVAGLSPFKMQSMWGNTPQAVQSTSHDETQPCSHSSSQQRRASAPLASEEEGSHTHTSTLKPCSASSATVQPSVSPHMERASSLEDPVVLSLLRQNLREKHSRHVADLKAYYESEIQILRDKLKLSDLPQDLEKTNQALTKRCKHLEKALAEATSRIQELEETNSSLEKKLAKWLERYAVADATVKSLQQQLEESKRSGKDKDALVARLKTHKRQLEEALQKANREADEKEAWRKREYKMLQHLQGEYDSLVKEHEGLKMSLISMENQLVDDDDQILKQRRVISKLEAQVKQLEYENQARARNASHSNSQPSGAGVLHRPVLLPLSKCKAKPDVTRRKSSCPVSDQLNSGRKLPFPQTNQATVHKQSQYPSSDEPSEGSVDTSSADGSRRCASPPECEQSLPQHRHQEQSVGQLEAGRREASCAPTPMMRTLIELEETRATETRAPWIYGKRTTVGFLERRHKKVIKERVGPQPDREVVKPGGVSAGAERGGAETASPRLRAQRSLSPEGHRSFSLPPLAHRNIPSATPTKRETLLMPLSAKSSPKRCPTENYSTAFGCPMPREEHLQKRVDGQVDQRRHSFHSRTPRKRLQFTSTDGEDDLQQLETSSSMRPPEGNSQLGWEEQGACTGSDQQDSWEDSAPLHLDQLHSLAEAEKLFDELTQEKQQIEAALSRMPAAGGRVSLQTRLDETTLENRLERVNRKLGSIRMMLKRNHVLHSAANI